MKVLQAMCKTSPPTPVRSWPTSPARSWSSRAASTPTGPTRAPRARRSSPTCLGGLGELAVIDGAGHYPHVQTPDEVLALALPFLAETLTRA